jgi:hypothetical protein
MLEAHAEMQQADMHKRAWELSHLLVAAGCKPEQVTVAKLLGEKEPKQPDPDAKTRRDVSKFFRGFEKRKQEVNSV